MIFIGDKRKYKEIFTDLLNDILNCAGFCNTIRKMYYEINKSAMIYRPYDLICDDFVGMVKRGETNINPMLATDIETAILPRHGINPYTPILETSIDASCYTHSLISSTMGKNGLFNIALAYVIDYNQLPKSSFACSIVPLYSSRGNIYSSCIILNSLRIYNSTNDYGNINKCGFINKLLVHEITHIALYILDDYVYEGEYGLYRNRSNSDYTIINELVCDIMGNLLSYDFDPQMIYHAINDIRLGIKRRAMRYLYRASTESVYEYLLDGIAM